MDIYLDLIVDALPVTLSVSACAWLVGGTLGMALGLAGGSRFRAVRETQFLVCTVLRGTPEVLAIYLLFFGLPDYGVDMPPFYATVVALGLTQAGFAAEAVRGTLDLVSVRQREAGQSLGLSHPQVYRHVVLPQILQPLLAPGLNMYVALMKLTAIASAVGLPELLHTGRSEMDRTYEVLPVMTALAVIYVVVTVPLTHLVGLAEKGRRRRTAPETMPVFS
ncbi:MULTISPECIES: amino acid ABC transporter permease [unclassified Streptomyces]|uniref:amino acid ABC transporter permease n=1 Tax=unclassified Streptomyces TaxID=2593676 RepID=UPI00136EEA3F|nr:MULTISPECIES: amino acid ABC transporter permease [unclassified Streptomyces]MCW5251429.1 amino acid ABC transporter permease [Streptomyces sp. SHP 1-2]MYU22502.1 ABC transporter permease subunit [Streptomyces sp. SID8352]